MVEVTTGNRTTTAAGTATAVTIVMARVATATITAAGTTNRSPTENRDTTGFRGENGSVPIFGMTEETDPSIRLPSAMNDWVVTDRETPRISGLE
jgi:hypothetical protein